MECEPGQRGAELKVITGAVNLIADLRAELGRSKTREDLLQRFTTLYHGRLSKLLDPVREGYMNGKRVAPNCMEFIDLQQGADSAILRYVAVRIIVENVETNIREIIDFLRSLVQDLTPVA
jgi:hypothetical protein